MRSRSISPATTSVAAALAPVLDTALLGTALLDAAQTDRRAVRRAATECAMREAALDLAEERGFDGFTVDEVAARAGVSPRTFFNYFPTKEAAVLADPDPVMKAMIAAVDERPDRPLGDAIHAAITTFLQMSTADEHAARRELALIEDQAFLRAARQSQYCAHECALAGAIAARMGTTLEADPLPLVLAAAAVGVARIVLVRWARTAEPAPDPTAVEELLERMSALLAA